LKVQDIWGQVELNGPYLHLVYTLFIGQNINTSKSKNTEIPTEARKQVNLQTQCMLISCHQNTA